MLQSIRDRAQGWLAWIIVGLIIIPFALWGIHQYFGGGADVDVARIDDTKITLSDFQQAYEQQRQRLRAMLGNDAALPGEAKMKQNVLDGLIRNAVIRQSANDIGLRISNVQIAKQIRDMPEFQDNGQFSKDLFSQVLRNQGMAEEGFESGLRHSLLSEQLHAGITSTTIVTPREIDNAIRLRKQQREIGYLLLPWGNFKKDVTISDAAVKEYYEAHRKELVNPEQVSVEYIELAASDIATQINPTEQELRKLYEEQSANFHVEEQRRVSQILIKPDKEAGLAGIPDILAEANTLVVRLQTGEAFDKLAQEKSDDPDTAKKGGDLGYVAKGTLDPAIEEALATLKVGQVSKPVQGPNGLYILKFTDVKPAHTKPFEEVRADLEKQYREDKAQQQFFEKAEPLANFTYEHPDTLAVATKELGLEVKTTGLFSRKGGEGLSAEPKVISAAFSDEVLGQSYNSEPIELGDKHLVVLRVREHKPATARSLQEERASITERLQAEAAQAKAQEVGESIQKRLRQGEDPQAIAKERSLEWVKSGFVGREDTKLNPAILRAAFKLAKPAPSAKDPPVVGGKALASGDYAVIAVYAVRDGNPATMDSAARLALKRELQRAKSVSEYSDFVDGLKKEAEIVVHQDKL